VSDADRARIEKVAAPHGDAVHVEKRSGRLEKAAYEMRGGIGITSNGWTCSSAFNVTNDSGERFMLTAGHCVTGGNYDWYRRNGDIYLGRQIHFRDEPGD
jgi:streptogrisin D